jgi:hypothetical protein
MELAQNTRGSDKPYSVKEWRSWERPYKRDKSVKHKAKHGKRLCEHCAWYPPAPEMLHAHHVVPIMAGGPDTIENLLVLCPNCHAVAHYVTARSNLTRSYTGPTTALDLRRWMTVAKNKAKLRDLQRRFIISGVTPLIASLRD